MGKPIYVRDVPDTVIEWIENTRTERLMSKQQLLLSVLQEASELKRDTDGVEIRCQTSMQVPFSFIDLFAGIGGLRIGLEAAGGQCRFSCEKDAHCQKTYREWFGEVPFGDITEIAPATIPDHDLLAAGFPCQPFSIAGVSKKKSLGREHGFKDKTQGTLFFHVASVIEAKRPPVVLLENVKNLKSHDKGQTWKVIQTTIEELGYVFRASVIDAANYVPQHRERIFIVCFDRKVFGDNPPFVFPSKDQNTPRPVLSSILEKNPPAKYVLTDRLWKYLQDYAERHRAKGNGFGFGLADPNGITRTLSARYYKDGSEILIPRARGNPRRLTPREAAKLMGFPEHLPIVVSDMQAYRQFGNAVVPKVSEAVAFEIAKVLRWKVLQQDGCLLKR